MSSWKPFGHWTRISNSEAMRIRDYITDQTFRQKVEEHDCLVVYDPKRRFRELTLSLASDRCRVIDASDSVIAQREKATELLQALANGSIQQLVIWIPATPPVDADQRQKDPFSAFGAIGAEFPSGDGDDYVSLCRRAKPDHVTEINRLFAEGEPDFDTIDALDHGGSWPALKTVLRAVSPKEILLGILSPTDAQEEALKEDSTWISEAREFVQRSLGVKLKTKGQTHTSFADELWRLLLFSEFVFDSPDEVPAEIEAVPRAGLEARGLVFEVCDELRKHADHKDLYLTKAMEIEEDLKLAARAGEMASLGQRDTFAFEERHLLQKATEEALQGRVDAAFAICSSRQKSIWLHHEKRLVEWSLASRALDLLVAASHLGQPKFENLNAIISGYTSNWRELDRRHREVEQAFNEWHDDHDGLEKLIEKARAAYFSAVEALQSEFIHLVQREGWPATGGTTLWNSRVFNEMVGPSLEDGKRVAYFLVDSLRYELGGELEKLLSERDSVSLRVACAQLPTYTEVGMASLMPGADTSLRLTRKEDKLATSLGGGIATTPAARFAYLKGVKGDQCDDIHLDDLLRLKRPKVSDRVRLLVVRTRDLDAIAHESPRHVLQIIPALLRQIIRGVGRVAEMGFDRAVIATDHGFILLHEQLAGNTVHKPPGKWLVEKARCLLGSGEGDAANVAFRPEEVGIEGDFESYVVPRKLLPFAKGQVYYHEGLSLAECVLPCLSVEFGTRSKPRRATVPTLALTYRQGKSDRITTRRPVIDLSWPEASLFAEDSEREVLVEAVDTKGVVVGSAASGEAVNPATGGVRIRPGQAISVGLRMDEEFSGRFKIRALDPETGVSLGDLELRTAYLE